MTMRAKVPKLMLNTGTSMVGLTSRDADGVYSTAQFVEHLRLMTADGIAWPCEPVLTLGAL